MMHGGFEHAHALLTSVCMMTHLVMTPSTIDTLAAHANYRLLLSSRVQADHTAKVSPVELMSCHMLMCHVILCYVDIMSCLGCQSLLQS